MMRVFLAWFPEEGETIRDAKKLEAFDDEDAARDRAAMSFRADPVDFGEPLVSVHNPESGSTRTFRVEVEDVPEFTAYEVEP